MSESTVRRAASGWQAACLPRGSRVEVAWGRWAGREGVLLRPVIRAAGGAMGRQYPHVRLEPRGRAAARDVIVVGVFLL